MLGRSVRPAHEQAAVSRRWVTPRCIRWRPPCRMPTGSMLTRRKSRSAGRQPGAGRERCWRRPSTPNRGALLATRGAASAPARMLASACGVGGRTLEALSRGARPELFNRLRECAALARQVAAANGLAYQVLALLLLQGEHNARALNGGTDDRAAYRELLARLYHDMVAELAEGIAGQERRRRCSSTRPAAPMPPTSWAWRWRSSMPGSACPAFGWWVPPTRSPTRAGIWMPTAIAGGRQFGKVMHRVLTLGEAWRPLHPVAAGWEGRAGARRASPCRWRLWPGAGRMPGTGRSRWPIAVSPCLMPTGWCRCRRWR